MAFHGGRHGLAPADSSMGTGDIGRADGTWLNITLPLFCWHKKRLPKPLQDYGNPEICRDWIHSSDPVWLGN